MNVKIGSLLSNITKTKKEITEIEEKILENRKVLLDYMVGVYKTQNTIYEDGKVDALKMILLD
jgi:peptidoglycan hydrolase CwlO-like protein